jgi:hypothetical protein
MRAKTSPKKMDAWLSRRAREGLTWADLSRTSGIPVWRLQYRERRQSALRATRRPRDRRRLLPVAVVDRSARPGLEIITPSGCRVLVPPDFDSDHLGRVLQALGASC